MQVPNRAVQTLADALRRRCTAHVVADSAYRGGGPTIQVPQRRRRIDPDTGRQEEVAGLDQWGDPKT